MSSFWIVPRTHRTGNIASQSFGAITDLGPRGARSTPAAPGDGRRQEQEQAPPAEQRPHRRSPVV